MMQLALTCDPPLGNGLQQNGNTAVAGPGNEIPDDTAVVVQVPNRQLHIGPPRHIAVKRHDTMFESQTYALVL